MQFEPHQNEWALHSVASWLQEEGAEMLALAMTSAPTSTIAAQERLILSALLLQCNTHMCAHTCVCPKCAVHMQPRQ